MFNKETVIKGKSTTIRPFLRQDISALYLSWLNDAETMRYSSQRFLVHDVNSSRSYVESFRNTPNGFFAIDDRETGSLIGTLTVYCAPRDGVVDVGILIGERSVAGKGYGKDCWVTRINWLSQQSTIRKITAGTTSLNTPMLSLIRAAGMEDDGCRRGHQLIAGEAVDIHYFAIFPHV